MTYSRDEIEKIVREAIESATGIDVEITPDLSLIDGGILDSMSMVSFVQTIQAKLDVEIDFADITLENFDSLEVLIPFLHGRLEEQ